MSLPKDSGKPILTGGNTVSSQASWANEGGKSTLHRFSGSVPLAYRQVSCQLHLAQ